MADTLSIQGAPWILVRLDWVQAVRRWLTWAQATTDSVEATEGATSSDEARVLGLMRAEVAELIRMADREMEASPLLFMRRRPELSPEEQPLPPLQPGEKGN